MEGRIGDTQPFQQGGGHPAGRGPNAADLDQAAHLVPHRQDVVADGLDLGSDSASPLDDRLTLGGGLHGATVHQHGA